MDKAPSIPHRIVPPEVWQALCLDVLIEQIYRPLIDALRINEIILRRVYGGHFPEITRMAKDAAPELPISTRR